MWLFIKKILESGNTTLIISNEKMNDIMKIISWQKALVKQLKIMQKNKKEDFSECY